MKKQNNVILEGTRTDGNDESNSRSHPITKLNETLPAISKGNESLSTISNDVVEIKKNASQLSVQILAIGSQAMQGMDRKRLEQTQTENFGKDGSYSLTTQLIAEGEKDSSTPPEEQSSSLKLDTTQLITICAAVILAMFLLSLIF